MADEDAGKKPLPGAPTEALRSDPHENARRAEETLDSPRRREQEQAIREGERALRDGGRDDGGMMRDMTLNRPPD